MRIRFKRALFCLLASLTAIVMVSAVSPTMASASVRVASPCWGEYYLGTAAKPTQAQLACTGHPVLKVNGPWPSHQVITNNHLQVTEVVFVSGELRIFFHTLDRTCVAIRKLASQSATGGSFSCYLNNS